MINLFYKTFKYIQKRKFWDTESFHIKADSSARQLQISVSDPGPAPWEGALQASSSLCDLVKKKAPTRFSAFPTTSWSFIHLHGWRCRYEELASSRGTVLI